MDSTTTNICTFCNEVGHSNKECNSNDLHELWSHLTNMVGHHSAWNEEAIANQKRFLQEEVPHYLVIAVAIRFCNLEYSYYLSFNDIIESIHKQLLYIYYLDMVNESEISEIEAEISEMLNQSIHLDDEMEQDQDQDQDQYIPKQWTIEPFLLCLETAEDLKEELFCSICLDDHMRLDTVITNCGHSFGKVCMCSHLDHQMTSISPTCPMCRTEVRTLEIKDADFYDELYERYVIAPISAMRIDIPDDLDLISDIAFLDSFNFMPQSVF